MTGYKEHPEAAEIASTLIPKHHEHLEKAKIRYLLTDRPMRRHARPLAGKALKASGLLKHFGKADFLLVFEKETWDQLTPEQRTALVDHELCHCAVKHTKAGEARWFIQGHDLEEFRGVVERHGLWHLDVVSFGRAIQEVLPLGGKQ
jgi:hypothetical protein